MVLASTNIKYLGLFSLSDLLQSLRAWFLEHKYDFQAPTHKQKGDEVEIEYEAELKANDYVKFMIKIAIKIIDYQQLEIVKEGQKKKSEKGRVEAIVSCDYALDYAKRFGGSKFLQKVQDFYHKYILKTTIQDVWEDILIMHFSQVSKLARQKLGHETV